MSSIMKGHNSVNNMGGVTVLVLCRLFDNALHCFMKISGTVLNL